jgi:hypothetical protein
MKIAINPITGRPDLVSVNTTVTTGGALTFLQLTDTPDSYSGESGSSLRVKGDESALEFYTPNADEKVKVNSTDTNSSYLASKLTNSTGISLTTLNTGSNELLSIENTEPDKIVSLTGGTGITTSGAYPDFTITNTLPYTGSADEKIKIDALDTSSDYLYPKITSSSKITRTILNTNSNEILSLDLDESQITHSQLAGLSSDDHTQYAKLLGRAGGQTLYGGTGSAETLTLSGNPANNGEIKINAPNLNPVNDSTTDLGGTANAYSNLYLNGYLRMRNPGSTSSAWNKIIANIQSSDTTYVWPDAYPTIGGQVLSSTTGGSLSWGTITPIGAIVMYGSAVAPSGWLICDGSEYATASYSNLYSVIGYTFGTGGSGATHFKVPNITDRYPRGYNVSTAAVGITGGATTYAHSVTSTAHFKEDAGITGKSYANHTGVEPPYLVLNFIIKY